MDAKPPRRESFSRNKCSQQRRTISSDRARAHNSFRRFCLVPWETPIGNVHFDGCRSYCSQYALESMQWRQRNSIDGACDAFNAHEDKGFSLFRWFEYNSVDVREWARPNNDRVNVENLNRLSIRYITVIVSACSHDIERTYRHRQHWEQQMGKNEDEYILRRRPFLAQHGLYPMEKSDWFIMVRYIISPIVLLTWRWNGRRS